MYKIVCRILGLNNVVTFSKLLPLILPKHWRDVWDDVAISDESVCELYNAITGMQFCLFFESTSSAQYFIGMCENNEYSPCLKDLKVYLDLLLRDLADAIGPFFWIDNQVRSIEFPPRPFRSIKVYEGTLEESSVDEAVPVRVTGTPYNLVLRHDNCGSMLIDDDIGSMATDLSVETDSLGEVQSTYTVPFQPSKSGRVRKWEGTDVPDFLSAVNPVTFGPDGAVKQIFVLYRPLGDGLVRLTKAGKQNLSLDGSGDF